MDLFSVSGSSLFLATEVLTRVDFYQSQLPRCPDWRHLLQWFLGSDQKEIVYLRLEAVSYAQYKETYTLKKNLLLLASYVNSIHAHTPGTQNLMNCNYSNCTTLLLNF